MTLIKNLKPAEEPMEEIIQKEVAPVAEQKNKKAKKAAPAGVKKKKSRSYSINDMYAWKFANQEMPLKWAEHLGNIDSRFLMYVDGKPGNGKTEYIMQGAKMFCNHMGKTRINNVEQGKHTQIKSSVIRNDFKNGIPVGKFQYDNIRDYEAFKAKLKRPNSGKVIIIDSISYWPLTVSQIQELIDTFKAKSFVFVGYEAQFTKNQSIIHLCDIKVRISNFVATVIGSRFGGAAHYYIWPERFAAKVAEPTLFDINPAAQ